MSPAVRKVIDGRRVSVYPAEGESVPLVVLSSYAEAGPDILAACRDAGAAPFALASVSDLRWDEDLSPWPHAPVVSGDDHFTGGASEYCAFLLGEALPFAERELGKPSYLVLGGYSMGGLFALYAPYLTDAFSKLVCASGSVWYPGFTEYARSHSFKRNPEAIYLSLGDAETRSRNPLLRTTRNAMEELEAYYRSLGIASVFELNRGGHYEHAVLRTARGIAWVLAN